MLKREFVDQEEEKIREKIRGLPDEKRNALYTITEKRIKDPDNYAALNWFSVSGLHHFYLEKWIRGTINFVLFVIGIITFSDGIGLLIILILFLVELPSLFRSQIIVKNQNNIIMNQAYTEVQSKL